ncbi:MAG: hypothetical protein ABIF77_15495 [bacterium]
MSWTVILTSSFFSTEKETAVWGLKGFGKTWSIPVIRDGISTVIFSLASSCQEPDSVWWWSW